MTPSPEIDRPQRADARRNRERILAAARQAFAALGADAQMDEVARLAGVGVGTVYRHFPTKDALLGELVRDKFTAMSANARVALEQSGEPFAVFADLLRRNAEQAARDVATQHAMLGAGDPVWTRAHAERDELLELTGELMAPAQRAGTMRADVRPTDIAMLMCGVCSTMTQAASGFDWRRHLELVIDSLRGPDPTGGRAARLKAFVGSVASHDAETVDFWRARSPAEHAAAGAELSDLACQIARQTGFTRDPGAMFPGLSALTRAAGRLA